MNEKQKKLCEAFKLLLNEVDINKLNTEQEEPKSNDFINMLSDDLLIAIDSTAENATQEELFEMGTFFFVLSHELANRMQGKKDNIEID